MGSGCCSPKFSRVQDVQGQPVPVQTQTSDPHFQWHSGKLSGDHILKTSLLLSLNEWILGNSSVNRARECIFVRKNYSYWYFQFKVKVSVYFPFSPWLYAKNIGNIIYVISYFLYPTSHITVWKLQFHFTYEEFLLRVVKDVVSTFCLHIFLGYFARWHHSLLTVIEAITVLSLDTTKLAPQIFALT